MLETVARKRRQKGGFLLRLLGRALEHFHGDFPSAHKRCGTSRASHKRDAVLADDHLRLFYAHGGPLMDGEFIGNLRPFPIVRAELFEKILDGDPLIFLFSFGRRETRVEEGGFERDVSTARSRHRLSPRRTGRRQFAPAPSSPAADSDQSTSMDSGLQLAPR